MELGIFIENRRSDGGVVKNILEISGKTGRRENDFLEISTKTKHKTLVKTSKFENGLFGERRQEKAGIMRKNFT